MRIMTVGELLISTEGMLLRGSESDSFDNISTDSRTVKAGDCFFALKGERLDAHDFLKDVVTAGCTTLVISDEKSAEELDDFIKQKGDYEINTVLVEDCLEALRKLAAAYLCELPLKAKIAVTGSVGKTSTRDMLYYVMSSKYKTARSIKNFNNAFGLPLSILSFPPDTEMAVIEMGMDGKGSIDYNASIVKPDTAIITNIGISHIGNFREEGRAGIMNTKLEVCNYFDDDSLLIINSDNDMLSLLDLSEKNIKGSLLRVGSSIDADFRIADVNDSGSEGFDFTLIHGDASHRVSLGVPGAHNTLNAALAIAAGTRYGIDVSDAIAALGEIKLTEKRLSIKEKRGIRLIDDTYNAAPESMKSAINTLMSTDTKAKGRRIAILGDMGELGVESVNAHREIGRYVYEKRVDILLAIGEKSDEMIGGWEESAEQAGGSLKVISEKPYIVFDEKSKLQAEHFSDKETVISGINRHLISGDIVLVKASRFMELEKIVKAVTGEKDE